MKPWERALRRDPPCAFIEAVVDGFSPIDKYICAFARRAADIRASNWWFDEPYCGVGGDNRGCVLRGRGYLLTYSFCNEASGEVLTPT